MTIYAVKNTTSAQLCAVQALMGKEISKVNMESYRWLTFDFWFYFNQQL